MKIQDKHISGCSSDETITAPHGVIPAILALGFGGLFIGTGEFASMSLLPGMAQSTGVSIPVAGSYISSYALGVVIGAPLIAVLAARWPRKELLLALVVLFMVGSIASALAWSHVTLLAARFIAGFPHGAFYGVASLVAAAMVDANRRAQAVGYVMLGLAAANVIGVPTATWLGQTFGWRAAFAAIAFGGAITAAMLWLYVPVMASPRGASPRTELNGLRRPQLWLTLAIASIGFGGMFAVYSYITPTLVEVTGLPIERVPLALAIWGLGMVVGNIAGARLADRALVPSIFAMLAWNAAFLIAFSLVAQSEFWTLCVLFLIGNGFALVPALQTRLMSVAGEAQTLAAALNHSAFNISNAIGASLGGIAIANGLGWVSTGWVGGLLAISGILPMALGTIMKTADRNAMPKARKDGMSNKASMTQGAKSRVAVSAMVNRRNLSLCLKAAAIQRFSTLGNRQVKGRKMSNHNITVSYSVPLFCTVPGSSSRHQRGSVDTEMGALFSYEKEELLAALRRDLREQRRKAKENPRDAECYLFRSRTLLRILDVLNPKTVSPLSRYLRVQGARFDEQPKGQGGRVISTGAKNPAETAHC